MQQQDSNRIYGPVFVTVLKRWDICSKPIQWWCWNGAVVIALLRCSGKINYAPCCYL